jgi:hypothetical protein
MTYVVEMKVEYKFAEVPHSRHTADDTPRFSFYNHHVEAFTKEEAEEMAHQILVKDMASLHQEIINIEYTSTVFQVTYIVEHKVSYYDEAAEQKIDGKEVIETDTFISEVNAPTQEEAETEAYQACMAYQSINYIIREIEFIGIKEKGS